MGSMFLMLLALLLGAWIAFRLGRMGWTFGLGAGALYPGTTIAEALPWPVYAVTVVLGSALLWHRASRSAAVITRWSGRSRRKKGTASTTDISRRASARALRVKKARTIRPSLAPLSRIALSRVPAAEFAVELCSTGLQTVWAAIEDVILVVGGPRSGKTGWLAGRIIDAPGAVVITSTRTDLLDLTGKLRAEKGPVLVFNAVGLGGIASTITFDPLTGCTDPVTATERATDMISAVSKGGAGGDRDFWDAQARRVLAAFLHAAALGGKPMQDVKMWLGDPDRARREIPPLLAKSGMQAFTHDANQFLGTNDKTKTSITTTVALALGWLNHPAAEKAAKRGDGFDVADLIARRATVFLLGAEETSVAPLMCALTGHIAREARRIAATRPSGRLDPPLGLYLDEAFLICPVPLESWTADMGGRNVTIIAVFQSRAQMLDRYGAAKTAQIMTNAAAKLVFGGTGDRDDLQFWSTLAGDRDERVKTTDLHGRVASKTVRSVPVVAPSQIANLPEGRVIVFRRGIDPVIGKARMAWERPDVHAAHNPDAWTVITRARITAARTWVGKRIVAAALEVLAVLTAGRLATGRQLHRAWLAVLAGLCTVWAWVRRMVAWRPSWLDATATAGGSVHAVLTLPPGSDSAGAAVVHGPWPTTPPSPAPVNPDGSGTAGLPTQQEFRDWLTQHNARLTTNHATDPPADAQALDRDERSTDDAQVDELAVEQPVQPATEHHDSDDEGRGDQAGPDPDGRTPS